LVLKHVSWRGGGGDASTKVDTVAWQKTVEGAVVVIVMRTEMVSVVLAVVAKKQAQYGGLLHSTSQRDSRQQTADSRQRQQTIPRT
jgi:hypothetical protein